MASGGEGLTGGTRASPGSATSGREILVALAEPLAPDRAEEFARLVYFIDESIEEFAFSHDADGNVTGVLVTVAGQPDGQRERLGHQFNAMLSGDFSRTAAVARRTLWQVAGARLPADAYDDLVASGAAFRSAEGQVAIGGPMLTALEFLDARLRDLARSYGAVEYRYPTLLPTSVIEGAATSTRFRTWSCSSAGCAATPATTSDSAPPGAAARRSRTRPGASRAMRVTACRRRCASTPTISTPAVGSPPPPTRS